MRTVFYSIDQGCRIDEFAAVYLGGVGHHESQLHPDNRVALFQVSQCEAENKYNGSIMTEQTVTALQFSFGTSLGLLKASLVCLLIRIFAHRIFKIVGASDLTFSSLRVRSIEGKKLIGVII